MPFELMIVTPEGLAFEGSVDRVVLPGSEGDFGVLASHERFLSPLKIGAVEITTSAGTSVHAAISDGFAEVNGEEVAVLVDTCEFAADIDAARAEAAHARAQQNVESTSSETDALDYAGYESALARAKVRLEVRGKV